MTPTDDEVRHMVLWFGGRYPPQFDKPCKDVMRGGIYRLLGIVSPSKVFRECLFCSTPCEWWCIHHFEMLERYENGNNG